MGYYDYIIATPEPMFTIFLNCNPLTAGLGTSFTAYWKKTGFCAVTFILGLVQKTLTMMGFVMLMPQLAWLLWLPGLICFWGGYIWNLYHTFQVYKASRAVYHTQN